MDAIALNRPDLVERLALFAREREMEPEAALDAAVVEFLERTNSGPNGKLSVEHGAFVAMHAALVEKYHGQYVAIHHGDVVDHDADLRALHLRMRELFGRTPVLLRKVSAEPQLPDLVFHSPRLTPPLP